MYIQIIRESIARIRRESNRMNEHIKKSPSVLAHQRQKKENVYTESISCETEKIKCVMLDDTETSKEITDDKLTEDKHDQ